MALAFSTALSLLHIAVAMATAYSACLATGPASTATWLEPAPTAHPFRRYTAARLTASQYASATGPSDVSVSGDSVVCYR